MISRRRRTRWALAAIVGALYLATAAGIGWFGHTPARPLYDATGVTPIPYRWVRPPSEFSVDNVKPTPLHTTKPFGTPVQVNTSDGQAVLSIPQGALPPRLGDTAVAIDLVPVDPAQLRRLPDGLKADGNAYLVNFTYQPSGAVLPTTAVPFDIVLREPQFGLTDHNLLVTTGRTETWRQLPSVQAGTASRGASSDQAGYYIVSGVTTTSGGSVARVAAVTGGAMVILVLLFIGVRAGRRVLGR